MFKDNHPKIDCAFAEHLIAYLYDEIGWAEKVKFETHLEKCSECRIELTKFGLARSAIREWRVEKFDILPTPQFEIPSNGVQIQTAAATESRSRFASWRQLFNFGPALAAASIVIVMVVTAFLTFNRHSDQEIAGTINNVSSGKIAVSPTVEKSVNPSETPEIARIGSPIVKSNVPAADKKSSAVRIQAVRTSPNQTRVNSGGDQSPKAAQPSGKSDEKRNTTTKSAVPRLIETDDDEDNSVRLTDLFDEIGTE